MNTILVDVGSGLTKFSDLENLDCFPSECGKLLDTSEFSFGLKDYEVIKVNGDVWLTGIAAQTTLKRENRTITTKPNWAEDEAQTILVYAAIAKMFPDGYEGQLRFIGGVPIAKFSDVSVDYGNRFSQRHSFQTLNNVTYDIEFVPEQNIILPQVVGLHFKALKEGESLKLHTKKVGYIDPGTQTIGWAVVDRNAFNPRLSDGRNVGLVKLAKALAKHIEKQHNWKSGDETIYLRALWEGYLEFFNNGKAETIDITPYAKSLAPDVYRSTLEDICKQWEHARDMHVFVSSGGGEYLIDLIKAFIPHACLISDMNKSRTKGKKTDPIFHVLEGYKLYANAMNKAS